MNLLLKTVKDIKELKKIQGASNIAKHALKALIWVSKTSKAKTTGNFKRELKKAEQLLINARPTEPMTRNAIKYVIYMAKKEKDIKKLKKRIIFYSKKCLDKFKKAKITIAEIGSRKVKQNSSILTHCHSSNVINILKNCKKKKIKVVCTETRPLFQGRRTARDLTKVGVPVTMIVDSAAANLIRKCSMVIIGADVITSEGNIINKIGSKALAILSKHYDIPFYIAAETWKFNPKTAFGEIETIEQRNPKEVWKNPPKKLKILNPAFEAVGKELIDGIITEEGVFAPESIYSIFNNKFKWMFE